MPERLLRTFDNAFAVPPAYALAWLTDFRPEDMRTVEGEKAPLIQVSRLPGGGIQRDFEMMGMAMQTRTSVESSSRWVALGSAKDKKGRDVVRFRIVETVAPKGSGTHHRVDFYREDVTTMAEIMTVVMKGPQRRSIQKIFDVNQREMQVAFNAGKPATT